MFAKTKSIFRERNTIFLENITYDPCIHIMDRSDLIVYRFMEKSIGQKGLKHELMLCLQQLKLVQLSPW